MTDTALFGIVVAVVASLAGSLAGCVCGVFIDLREIPRQDL